MTMTIRYNTGAQMSLGELNKNNNMLGKTLAKISSGQRIVGADDDGSSYSISERMRTRIRALFQDDQNVQNGSSMLRIAERGVDQIIQILRTMKELAIDAANDSNTDDDRHTIQKELDQCRHVINDIALGSQYNGKILLDGRYGESPTPLEKGSGGKNTSVQNIREAFKAGNNARDITTPGLKSGYSGMPPVWRFPLDKNFVSASGGTFSVDLDFSAIKVKGSYPNALNGQGFTILCGGCMQYVNFLFDANKTESESTYDDTDCVAEDGSTNSQASEYTIGVKNVRDSSELADAIFKGIATARSLSAASNSILVDSNHTLTMTRDSSGRISLSKNGPAMQFLEGTIPNPVKNPLPPAQVGRLYKNPLWIQHGTQAGQRVHVNIEDMQSNALGIDAAEVTTKEKANSAIGIIESAIESALDEATNLGAHLQRLETIDANITTMNENVQAAESTIRDADMAKEMTEYAKYNLLKQSSQTMLAQANQNGSAVLGLLQ